MNLFKSQAQRQLERHMDIRRGIQVIRRNLRNLEKSVSEYRGKAVRARMIGGEQGRRASETRLRQNEEANHRRENELVEMQHQAALDDVPE